MANIELDPEDRQEEGNPPEAEPAADHPGPLKDRLGGALGALGKARRRSKESLRDLSRTVAAVGDRIKSTPTAERLNAAVDTRRLIWKAADAQRRGNPAMAYRLLEPLAREKPDDPQVVVAFWSAACACERADEAAPALVHTIRRLTSAAKLDRAAELWSELHEVAPGSLLDPGTLVRIAPALLESAGSELVVEALRDAVNPRNAGLSPGIAVRIAEMALEPDPSTALRAARFALASPELHEARREHLENIVAEGERAGGEVPPDHADAPLQIEDVAAAAVYDVAPASRFATVKVTEAMPIGFENAVIAMQIEGGRRGGARYEKIDAISVAKVAGVVVIDLVLNWSHDEDEVLHVVRLRSDGFDPRMVFGASGTQVDPLAAFLGELMSRSEATPLPDPDSVLGLNLRTYQTVSLYERGVLLVES